MNPLLVLGGLAWAAAPTLSFLGSPAYRCEYHPLARLSVAVEEGMALETVLARFEAYADGNDPDAGGVAVLGDIVPTGAPGQPKVASRVLFIEDLWMDGEVELVAWFDGTGRVDGSRYRCTG